MATYSKKAKIGISWLLVLSLALSFNFGVFAEEGVAVPTETEVSAAPSMRIESAEVVFRPGTVGPAAIRTGLSQEQAEYMLATYRRTRVADPTHAKADQFRIGQGDMYRLEPTGPIFTYLRNASLSESRIFNIQAVIGRSQLGISDISQFDKDKVELWYGVRDDRIAGELNRPLGNIPGAWSGSAEHFNFGSGLISDVVDIKAVTNGDDVVMDIKLRFFNLANDGAGFGGAGSQGRVDLLDALRRGNASIRLFYDTVAAPLATMPFEIKYRDYQDTWRQLEDYLLENKDGFGEFIDWDGETRRVTPGDGSFSFGDRFVRVESLGKTHGVQTGNAAGGFPPLPNGPEDIWVAIVSDSKASLDTYINEVVPMMNTNPLAVRSTFGNRVRLPVVYTNIHSGEQAGPDGVFHLFNLVAQEEYVKFDRAVRVRHQGPNLTTNRGRPSTNLGSDWTGGPFHDHFQMEHYGFEDRVGQANFGTHIFENKDHYMSFWNIMDPLFGSEEIVMDIDELLDNYIFIFLFTQNPDGRQQGGIRGMTYGMDPNRDGVFHTMPESVAGKGFLAEW